MLHNTGEYCFISREIPRQRDLTSWRSQLCTGIVDFAPVEFSTFKNYAKNYVYVDKSLTLDYLKSNIRRVMAERSPIFCQKVVESCLKVIEVCKNLREM